MQFGKLHVVKYIRNDGHNTIWLCKCECGGEIEVQGGLLRRGQNTQCRKCSDISRRGTKKPRVHNFNGKIFGKLTVIERINSTGACKASRWKCQCSCGNIVEAYSHNLMNGHQTQCALCADTEAALKRVGPGNGQWLGGRSFGKYCPRFNTKLKEEIREKYDRKCYICGKPEGKRKHSVHHIDYNKVQGCKGMRWSLVPLCASCHAKTNSNRHFWFNFLYPAHVLEGLDNWGKLGDDIIG